MNTIITAVVTLVAGVVAVVCADLFLRKKNDTKEQQDIYARIPFLNYVVSLLVAGRGYYDAASKMVMGLLNGGGEQESSAFMRELDNAIHKSLLPGPDLDSMNKYTAVELEKALAEKVSGSKGPFGFHAWLRHTLTVASTTGVYGPLNPFRLRGIEDDFWTWEEDQFTTSAGAATDLSPSAAQAAQNLTAAFSSYFSTAAHSRASSLLKSRHEIYENHAVPLPDRARLECTLSAAMLPNTIPTAFWTIYEILLRSNLLEDIRAEVAQAVRKETKASASTKFTLDVAEMKNSCKLLLSTMQETQRHRSRHARIKKGSSGTVVDAEFRLQKGNSVQLPTRHLHKDKKFWGRDAESFSPARFCSPSAPIVAADGTPVPKMPRKLLAWGFTPNLCPGRQFATTEIMVLIALLVMRFDVVPVGGSVGSKEVFNEEGADSEERDVLGGMEDTAFPLLQEKPTETAVYPPREDMQVLFEPRKAWLGSWAVDVGRSEEEFLLACG